MSRVEIELDALDLLVIKIKTADGSVKTFDISDELTIEDINEAHIDQAGKFAFWASVSEVAKANVEMAKADMETAEAEADEKARKYLEMEGIKITEKAVERAIKGESSFVDAQKKYLQAKRNAGVLKSVAEAFEHRKEMIIGLGANHRQEYDGSRELRTMKEKAKGITNR